MCQYILLDSTIAAYNTPRQQCSVLILAHKDSQAAVQYANITAQGLPGSRAVYTSQYTSAHSQTVGQYIHPSILAHIHRQ